MSQLTFSVIHHNTLPKYQKNWYGRTYAKFRATSTKRTLCRIAQCVYNAINMPYKYQLFMV